MNIINRAKEFGLIFYQLTRPLSYLRIKHEDKWIYDWLIPVLITAATVYVSFNFIEPKDLLGPNGLISSIVGFVANLPGFFIAALAAVATFNKDDIDQTMDNPPKIEIMYQGNCQMVDMTRRRFLCVLFSYLTAISIFIVLFTKISLSIDLGQEHKYLSWIGITVFFFLLWQMVVATVLGLYYLGERLHTPSA